MLITLYDYLIYRNKSQTKAQTKAQYKKQKYRCMKRYITNTELSYDYVKTKAYNKRNNLLLYSIQTTEKNALDHTIKHHRPRIPIEYDLAHIAGIVLYRIILQTKKKLRIYIPILSILNEFRGYGYGTLLMEDIITRFTHRIQGQATQQTRHGTPQPILEIVLLSLPNAIPFYKKFGFKESSSRYIERNETIEPDEIIMMLQIHPSNFIHLISHR